MLRPSGNINPGKLDRRVAIHSASQARDAVGGSIDTWSVLATVWAAKLQKAGNRLFAAEAKHYEADLTYRIRHRADVRAGMRVVHGDDTYEITHATEQGRARFLDLECRALDQTPAET